MLKNLFQGEFANYIRCTDVDFVSERKEPFWDLQLSIRDEEALAQAEMQ